MLLCAGSGLWGYATGCRSLEKMQAPEEADWSLCDIGLFDVHHVSLKPAQISRGTTAFFSIGATSRAGDVIEDGAIYMSVSLAGVPVHSEKDELCSKSRCPIEPKTAFQINYTRHFPLYTPPGSYEMKLQGVQGGQMLFCLNIKFRVTFFGDVHWVGRKERLGEGGSEGRSHDVLHQEKPVVVVQ